MAGGKGVSGGDKWNKENLEVQREHVASSYHLGGGVGSGMDTGKINSKIIKALPDKKNIILN